MMNVIEAMKERRSVRSFDGEPLDEATRRKLMDFIASIYDPFEGHFTVRLKQFDLKNGFKPSTYGIIKGANDFFTMAIADDEVSALAAGFGFEQVVLKAWQIGLGTCWIGGTFKGSDFEKEQSWPDGESLKIVSPVGVAAKKRMVENIMRAVGRSDKRTPFSQLFFTDDFTRPADPEGRFGEALEMLRLAPSSTNSQPWRALVEFNKVHFFYKPKSALSVLDCGIGLCHFYETEKFNGKDGFFSKEPFIPAEHSNWRYLTTYTAI